MAKAASAQQADKLDCVQAISKVLRKPLFIFDLETTGADKNKDEIVQFAALIITPTGGYRKLEFVCKPNIPIHPKATEVHGITNERVSTEKPFSFYAPAVLEALKECDIAGFNLKRFDWPILTRQLKEAGHPVPDGLEPVIYDAYVVFCHHQSRKLTDAIAYYTSESIEDAHDAMGDVISTTKVIAKQMEKENLGVEEIVKKVAPKDEEQKVLERFIYEKDGKVFLAFGKHKDKEIDKIDPGFFRWVLKADFPECFRKVAKKYADKS